LDSNDAYTNINERRLRMDNIIINESLMSSFKKEIIFLKLFSTYRKVEI